MAVRTHEEWLAKLKPLSRGGPKSLPALQSLAREVKRALKTSITDWHQQQIEGLIAQFLDEAGQTVSSASAFKALARQNHQQVMYYLESTRSSLEAAAELYDKAGRKSVAKRLRAEAGSLAAFQASRTKGLGGGKRRGA
jgi:hypothetical protein